MEIFASIFYHLQNCTKSNRCVPLWHLIRVYTVFLRSILSSEYITKTCLYNFDPLKPHFYILKLGFTGVYIIFLISAQNIDCGYLLEPPRRGGSNEYPQSMFLAEIWKISEFFLSENCHFLVGKFSVYLNRHVFVMTYGKLIPIFIRPDSNEHHMTYNVQRKPYNISSLIGLV